MADLGGKFDAGSVEPSGSLEPLPAGKYRCAIVRSEWKPTKAGTGRYIEFAFQVLEGDAKGRMVFARLNLENPNGTAVEIARQELSAICRAVGNMSPQDTAELHDIPLIVKVALKQRDDNGEMTNEVKGYEPVSQSQPRQSAASDSPQPSNKPAWA